MRELPDPPGLAYPSPSKFSSGGSAAGDEAAGNRALALALLTTLMAAATAPDEEEVARAEAPRGEDAGEAVMKGEQPGARLAEGGTQAEEVWHVVHGAGEAPPSTLTAAAPSAAPSAAPLAAAAAEPPPTGLLGGLLKLGRFTSQLAGSSSTSLGSGSGGIETRRGNGGGGGGSSGSSLGLGIAPSGAGVLSPSSVPPLPALGREATTAPAAPPATSVPDPVASPVGPSRALAVGSASGGTADSASWAPSTREPWGTGLPSRLHGSGGRRASLRILQVNNGQPVTAVVLMPGGGSGTTAVDDDVGAEEGIPLACPVYCVGYGGMLRAYEEAAHPFRWDTIREEAEGSKESL